MVSELFGTFCSGQHWAIHFLSRARMVGKQSSLLHHRAVSCCLAGWGGWGAGLRGGQGWEVGAAVLKKALADSPSRWGSFYPDPHLSAAVCVRLPSMATPRLLILPPGPSGRMNLVPAPLWKSGLHPPRHLLSISNSPVSHPGTEACFPLMALLSDSMPQHPQDREEKAGFQRLAGWRQILALPLASRVVSGK